MGSAFPVADAAWAKASSVMIRSWHSGASVSTFQRSSLPFPLWPPASSRTCHSDRIDHHVEQATPDISVPPSSLVPSLPSYSVLDETFYFTVRLLSRVLFLRLAFLPHSGGCILDLSFRITSRLPSNTISVTRHAMKLQLPKLELPMSNTYECEYSVSEGWDRYEYS